MNSNQTFWFKTCALGTYHTIDHCGYPFFHVWSKISFLLTKTCLTQLSHHFNYLAFIEITLFCIKHSIIWLTSQYTLSLKFWWSDLNQIVDQLSIIKYEITFLIISATYLYISFNVILRILIVIFQSAEYLKTFEIWCSDWYFFNFYTLTGCNLLSILAKTRL